MTSPPLAMVSGVPAARQNNRMSVLADIIFVMNKFDAVGFEKMMARIAAEEQVPGDGPMTEFSQADAPLVRSGDIYGRAVAFTWHHGLIEWTDSRGKYHFDWFPADAIKRIPKGDDDGSTTSAS